MTKVNPDWIELTVKLTPSEYAALTTEDGLVAAPMFADIFSAVRRAALERSSSYTPGEDPTPERDVHAEREYLQRRADHAKYLLEMAKRDSDEDSDIVRNLLADVDEARAALARFEKAVSYAVN